MSTGGNAIFKQRKTGAHSELSLETFYLMQLLTVQLNYCSFFVQIGFRREAQSVSVALDPG